MCGCCPGGYWRSQQVPDQRKQREQQPCAGSVPLRAAECQQPALPDHAGPHHQSAEHETARGQWFVLFVFLCLRDCFSRYPHITLVCLAWPCRCSLFSPG